MIRAHFGPSWKQVEKEELDPNRDLPVEPKLSKEA